jgi:cytochrome d ubiquinol oxidase subunit I
MRRRPPERGRWFLRATIAVGPLGFLALEAGWMVTEMGRQPWVVYNVIRTNDTVTPMPGLAAPFVAFTLVYIGLAIACAFTFWRQVKESLA